MKVEIFSPHEISTLLRGELTAINGWIKQWSVRRFLFHIGIIILGAGFYGAAMGWWRDPQQALFTAIKFPLIILLTTIGNVLINAMFAPLLGLNIPFRQSFCAIVMSFTIAQKDWRNGMFKPSSGANMALMSTLPMVDRKSVV